MDLSRLAHDPMTCRWGRMSPRTTGQPDREAAAATWLCQPPSAANPREVLAQECGTCANWEPRIIPPCAAIGWGS